MPGVEAGSEQARLHGVLVDVTGIGVLLQGPSGSGKSECALDLVVRGHRLVVDDLILVSRESLRIVIKPMGHRAARQFADRLDRELQRPPPLPATSEEDTE